MPRGSRQFGGEIKETTRIPGHCARHRFRSYLPRSSETSDSMRHPRRLIAFAPIRNWSQIRGVRLRENAIIRNEAEQPIVGPLPERHDPAERHVPSGFKRGFGKLVRAGITMQHTDNFSLPCLDHHRTRVGFGVSRVNDNGQSRFARKPELLGKGAPLLDPRGVVIVIVESAFADGHSTSRGMFAEPLDIPTRIEADCIVRMNAGRIPYISWIANRDGLRRASGAEDIPGAAS